MSKIKLKTTLKTEKSIHTYEGKGIISNDVITYNDNGILTKIIIKEPLIIQRKSNYFIELGFKTNETILGTYSISEGKLQTKVNTKELKIEKNSIKIKYNLKINNVNIDDFEFILIYTIDSK